LFSCLLLIILLCLLSELENQIWFSSVVEDLVFSITPFVLYTILLFCWNLTSVRKKYKIILNIPWVNGEIIQIVKKINLIKKSKKWYVTFPKHIKSMGKEWVGGKKYVTLEGSIYHLQYFSMLSIIYIKGILLRL